MGLSLVDVRAWVLADPDADPFAAFAQGRVRCGPDDWHRDRTEIEIETKRCGHATLVQQASLDVGPGDELAFVAWWHRLLSLTPATGYFALAIGTKVVWEVKVAIPGEADLREVVLTDLPPIRRGDPIYVHVHNHGYNTWKLGPIFVR